MAIEIVGFPSKYGGSFHSFLSNCLPKGTKCPHETNMFSAKWHLLGRSDTRHSTRDLPSGAQQPSTGWHRSGAQAEDQLVLSKWSVAININVHDSDWLELPIIYSWPMFQGYVRGCTSKYQHVRNHEPCWGLRDWSSSWNPRDPAPNSPPWTPHRYSSAGDSSVNGEKAAMGCLGDLQYLDIEQSSGHSCYWSLLDIVRILIFHYCYNVGPPFDG